MVQRAVELGMPALAITDHDGLYAVIDFYRSCKESGIRPVIGAEITLEGGYHLTLLARDNTGYRNLCRIITRSHLAHEKGNPSVNLETIAEHTGGLFCLSGCRKGEIPTLILSDELSQAHQAATRHIDIFGKGNFWLEIQNNLYPEDKKLCRALVEMAHSLDVGYVATNNAHYAREESYRLHDVLIAIRNRTTLDECQHLRMNSEFYLKSGQEMGKLFRKYPKAISNTLVLAEACNIGLDFSAYRFPDFPLPTGETAHSYLNKICRQRVAEKYQSVTAKVENQLAYELELIQKLDLSGYFLIVWDIMEYARKNGIPAQGRGSAANSIVAYILGITRVDPIENRLFVGRFINEEMSSIPDIDIDISTNHREDLIQYVYHKYGADHTAMVATFVTFQARNAIREVGKVMGLPANILDHMARSVSVYGATDIKEDLLKLEEFRSHLSSQAWETFASLCQQIADFPRHLSIHVGGMLISSCPLSEIAPLENAAMPGRIVCQWDKDGVADAGLIKVDLLGLRMLSLMQETLEMVEQAGGQRVNLSKIPHDDPKVYDMICKADTIGVFQIESRAQMQTLPQTKPRSIEDLTVEVAIIRPGPLQGNMVHPYIHRRKKLEKVSYPHPSLKPVLEETLGVILFQEQVIQVATIIAGFSPGEADSLRRAMSRKRSREAMEQMFETLKGFAEYGFCKSHAAGFALLCYESAWLKVYYPAPFYAALLNNQPMGFYTPDVVISDAKRHGVSILPVDINRSQDRCTVEDDKIRLGLMYVKGLGEKTIDTILKEKGQRSFASLEDFHYRTRIDTKATENLIMIGAFDAFGHPRRETLWQLGVIEKAQPGEMPLPSGSSQVSLPGLSDMEELKLDYEVQGLSAKYHPMQVLRGQTDAKKILRSSQINLLPSGEKVCCAGYVITRQRPGTAKGFSFLTLEDEDGTMNIILKPAVYERHRQIFRLAPIVLVDGVVQKRDGIVNIIAQSLAPFPENGSSMPQHAFAECKWRC